MERRSSAATPTERDPRDRNVADAIAPIVAQPAIAFRDCDRPPMLAPSPGVTRERKRRDEGSKLKSTSRTAYFWLWAPTEPNRPRATAEATYCALQLMYGLGGSLRPDDAAALRDHLRERFGR